MGSVFKRVKDLEISAYLLSSITRPGDFHHLATEVEKLMNKFDIPQEEAKSYVAVQEWERLGRLWMLKKQIEDASDFK